MNDRAPISNPNAKAFWIEVDVDASGSKTILVVATDLELDQAEPGYDAAKVHALIDDVNRHRSANRYLDAVRLVRKWSNAPWS